MADADARREARRRRILQNLDNRLEKITGKCKENFIEEKFSKEVNHSRLKVENSSITTKTISTIRNKTTSTECKTDLLKQDKFEIAETFESNVKFHQPNIYTTFDHSNYQYYFQENRKDINNLNCNLTITSVNQIIYKQSQYWFPSLIFRPLSYIFLAAFVNILVISNVDISLYKGIVTPYIIMSITQLCFGKKFEKFRDNSILVATLILFNIKPEILNNLKIILNLCSTILKDFALYLTSFVVFNWIASICCSNLNHIQFF